ncbi:MAG: thiol-disulfide isomerase/thioredoxin [Bacteroidia bacterium]|jgi:thiol-disulfide isomerase/thioredoxin
MSHFERYTTQYQWLTNGKFECQLMRMACLIIIISLFGCQKPKQARLDAVNYEALKSVIEKNDNKLYVVNFWATWCKPCMEELPHFLEVDEQFSKNKNYEMILVSLDKSSNLNVGVANVVRTMAITPDVLLLDDAKRMNEWIPAINEKWSGSIPATALYKNGIQLSFKEGKLTKQELETLIHKHI